MPSFSFIILHCSVIPYNQEKYTTHSFDRGPNFINTYIYISFKNLVYHPSCLSHSTLLEKCLSTTRSFLKGLSSLRFSRISSIILHCSLNECFWEGVDVACQAFLLSSCIVLSFHTTRKTILSLFTPLIGDWFYIYLYIFQESLSSCIALSIHALFYPYSLLWEEIDFIYIYIYIYIYLFIFQEYLLSSFIALSIHAFGRGWMLHVRVFFYHPALLCLPYY